MLLQQGLARGTQRIVTLRPGGVATRQDNWGVHLTDTFDITNALGAYLLGRYQITEVEIRDQTGDPANSNLDGNHDFHRFNPAGVSPTSSSRT